MFGAEKIFKEPSVFKKIELLRHCRDDLLTDVRSAEAEVRATGLGARSFKVAGLPARDAQILETKLHPPKKGFSTTVGQARMLHDLANIELQAMELGLRTLHEFPDAPPKFREELLGITLSEANHLEMCLIEIEKLGYRWGDWPVHLNLWKATSIDDSLLDRILIVHRYLEGSGLDAGETLFRRLELIDTPSVKKTVHQITADEVGHVDFGSRWYRVICVEQTLDPAKDYFSRMDRLLKILPRRFEPLAVQLRRRAGFTEDEIQYLMTVREGLLKKNEG